MSNKVDVGDLDNSMPSWISNHLGEKSYMADEVNQLLLPPLEESPPQDESSNHGENPEIDTRSPLKKGF